MNKLIVGSLFVVGAFCANAKTFYVNADPSVGNDGYDGKAAVWDGEHGPIRTLANITNLVTATTSEKAVGDTVYVAEGDYNFGSNATGEFRAELPNGTRLIGVGDRNKIRIFGSATDETQTVPTEGAMRTLNAGSWTLIKNLTLCNGRSAKNGGCLYLQTGSYLVGCVISNNYTTGRGGATPAGTAIRCLFTKNMADDTGKCAYATTCWNCVFDQVGMDDGGKYKVNYQLYNSTTYNCTFVGGGGTPRGNSHYNLLSQVRDSGNSSTTAYRSLFALDEKSTVDGGDSQWNVGVERLQLEGSYVPVQGANLGYDYGSNLVYTAKFPTSALVADQKDLDFNGNPRIQGEAIDCGACEADPAVRHLVLSDALTGLTIDGAALGTTVLKKEGDSITVRISRNYSTTKLCAGVNVNGEFFSFTGEDADRTYVRTYAFGDPVPYLRIEAVYAENNDWYVDRNNGDDANNGRTAYQAWQTLAMAATNGVVAKGDTVWVLPGVYADGVCNPESIDKAGPLVRLAVPAGVTFRSVRGPKETVILGAKSSAPNRSSTGCGTNAVRCVTLGDEDSMVVGFTLCGGRTFSTPAASTSSSSATYSGGAASGSGYLVDCIVTNNSCHSRGGALASGLHSVRCYFSGNDAGGVSSVGYNGGTYINCMFEKNIGTYAHYGNGVYYYMYNCTFKDGGTQTGPRGTGYAYNCLILCPLDGTISTSVSHLYNCYMTSKPNSATEMTDCVITNLADLAVDSEGRPLAGNIGIDAGSNLVYAAKFPSGLEGKDLDFAGGQRIYNQKIDVGCGEYDWRGDFAKRLAAKGVAVESAGANVTTNDLNGLVLLGGDVLKLKLTAKTDGEVSFNAVVAGVATLTVKVGEETYEAVDDVCTVPVPKGVTELAIALAGEGTATLSGFVLPKCGVLLIVK